MRAIADPVRRSGIPLPLLTLLTTTSGLDLPPRVARLLWDMWTLSDNSEARAFCYSMRSLLSQVVDAPETAAAFDAWRQAITKWLTPDLLHEALDELEQRELLAPHRCAQWHVRIRECTGADGSWKTSPSEPVNESTSE